MNGALAAAEVVARAGVTAAFACPGFHIAPLLTALREAGVRVVGARTSTNAVHMADGFARVVRGAGIACVTAGPGVTAALHGLAVAAADQSPVVLVAGAAGPDDARPWGLLRERPLVERLVRATIVAESAEAAPEAFAQALALAIGPPPAPVFLELPLAVQTAQAGEEIAQPIFVRGGPVPREAVAEVADAIARAERPLLCAGSGAYWAGADLRALAVAAGAPVLPVNLGRGLLADDAPEVASPAVSPGPADLAERADLVVILGARRAVRLPPFPRARLWQIDLDPDELESTPGGCVRADVALAARAIAEALRERGATARREGWWREVALARARLPGEGAAGRPIHPLYLARQAARAAGSGAILAVDGGDTRYWMAVACRCDEPGRYLESHASNAVGAGLPFAIGAAVARPGLPVLAFLGDGSAGMQLLELETAVREQLSLVVVVNNDRGMGLLRHASSEAFGKKDLPGTSLTPVRYDLVAEGVGAEGVWVTEPVDLPRELAAAVLSRAPTCVNVTTDPEVASPAASQLARTR